MRIIGLDYGTKTVGVAISDALGITAQRAYQSRNFQKTLVLLAQLLYYKHIYERDVRKMIDNNTQFFKTQPDKAISVEGILEQVYRALKEKGYNPVNQIVGYIMSGDPTYITSHNNARSLIMKVERDELVEEVIKYFIEGKGL